MLAGAFRAWDRPMSKRRKVIMVVLATLFCLAPWVPSAWRAGSIYWARSSAWRAIGKLGPDERRNLDTTPMTVIVPRGGLNSRAMDGGAVGGWTVRFPAGQAREDRATTITVTYPRFKVWVREPFGTVGMDGDARDLGFSDAYACMAAAYHARPDEIDTQPDLASLQRHLRLLMQKRTRAGVSRFAEFDRNDFRGFLMRDEQNHRIVAELYFPDRRAGCGIWFVDQGGMTVGDVEEFLGVLEFAPPLASTTSPVR
jgi:hypothetical protein